MKKVTGIGGLFFRARDHVALGRWYQEHLGITLTPSSYDELPWRQEAGDPQQMWMVNFRVRDLDDMTAQLRAAGIAVDLDPRLYPNGRLARLYDPEGNSVELWQPAGRDAPH
jgi:glyoxylase I family protein